MMKNRPHVYTVVHWLWHSTAGGSGSISGRGPQNGARTGPLNGGWTGTWGPSELGNVGIQGLLRIRMFY